MAKAGTSAVLLDPQWPAELVSRVLERAEPVGQIRADDVRAVLVRAGSRPGPVPPGPVPPGPVPPEPVPLDSVAYQVHTSGSTGQAKSVGVTRRALAHRAATHRDAYAIRPADRSAWLTSPGASMSSVELWPNLTAGASVHLPGPDVVASPVDLRDWLIAERITNAFIPMPVGEALLRLDWPASCALRLITVGGDSVRNWPPRPLPFEVAVEYGSAEANAVCSGLAGPQRCTSRTIGPAQRSARPPIGRPWPDVDVFVLDEQLRPVAEGARGDLYVGGPELARGYLRNPALTAARFVPHPWGDGQRMYRTGDIVRRGPTGLLYHHGRVDAQEKILGHRVEPVEVEAVLLQQPGVSAAVVTGRTDPFGDRRLVGYLLEQDAVDLGELRAFARRRLPPHMVPSVFLNLAEFPLNGSGKIDRLRLPEPPWPAPEAAPARPAPAGDVVIAGLLVLWSAELGGDDISPAADFRKAGGDSLHATRLLERVQERFGVRVRLRDFFREPTPAALARQIRMLRDAQQS
jgi:acyl-coenzyme A synthetase/AMP-(fatty) acid ligase/acyl carrier protein